MDGEEHSISRRYIKIYKGGLSISQRNFKAKGRKESK